MKTKYNLLERDKAKKALDDGFCVLFGENHRAFFEKVGEELIELGQKNGEEWCHYLLFFKVDRMGFQFELAQEGLIEKEKMDALVESLKVFFTDEEIENFKNNKELKKKEKRGEHPGAYSSGRDKYETLIVKTIKEKDVTLKLAKPFDYFKEFCLSELKQFKSVTLYGEGGLGLDQYMPSTMKYYKEEGELFYPIEAICRKYHYLGMLLKKEEILLSWIDKITKNMNKQTNYFVQNYLSSLIYEFSLRSISDEIILDIQDKTGVDINSGFITNKQLHKKVSEIGKKHKESEAKKTSN